MTATRAATVPAAAAPGTPALPSGAPPRPRNVATLGVLILATGGVMAFAALVAAYRALQHAGPLPPKGVKLDNYLGVMATLTMLLSVPLVEWGWTAVRREQRRQAITALGLTIAMGVAFIDLDWYLVSRLGFGVATPYGTVFYAMVAGSARRATPRLPRRGSNARTPPVPGSTTGHRGRARACPGGGLVLGVRGAGVGSGRAHPLPHCEIGEPCRVRW